MALTACGTGESGPPPVERTDSAGVEQVVNRGPETTLDWSFREAWRVGPADSGPEALFGVTEEGIATSGDGTLLVLDAGNYRVSAWDSSGTFLWTAGRQGDGPGELAYPSALLVDDAGRAWVKDLARESPVVFAPGGTRVDTTWAVPRVAGTPQFVGSAVVYTAREVQEDQAMYTVRMTGGPGASSGDPGLSLVQATTELAGSFQLESCGIGFSGMQRVFDTGLPRDAAGDRVAVATGPGYRIELFDAGGDLLRTVSRDVPLRPATPELAVQSLGEGFTVRTPGGERTCDPAEVVEKRGVAAYVPQVGRPILVGDELWVVRYVVGDDPAPVDVFAADGAYLGTLPPGSPIPAAVLPDGRIAVLEESELGVQSVAVYRVVRDGG